MDDQINEIEYIEKVITTLQSKYSLDNNKVSSCGALVWLLPVVSYRRSCHIGSVASRSCLTQQTCVRMHQTTYTPSAELGPIVAEKTVCLPDGLLVCSCG